MLNPHDKKNYIYSKIKKYYINLYEMSTRISDAETSIINFNINDLKEFHQSIEISINNLSSEVLMKLNVEQLKSICKDDTKKKNKYNKKIT